LICTGARGAETRRLSEGARASERTGKIEVEVEVGKEMWWMEEQEEESKTGKERERGREREREKEREREGGGRGRKGRSDAYGKASHQKQPDVSNGGEWDDERRNSCSLVEKGEEQRREEKREVKK
jgi:hypothetical protein